MLIFKTKIIKCFLWSVLAHLHPPQWNPERVKHYKKYENTLNVKDLKFPMSLSDIPKFEKMNNISVNVYGLTDTNNVQLLKFSNNYKNQKDAQGQHVEPFLLYRLFRTN